MRILEEFWYGNIEPTEYDTSSCKEYKKLLELICRNEESRTNQQQLKSDFILYLNGFSQNVQDIIKRFEFRNQIDKLSEHDILGLLISKFTDSSVNLSNRPIYDAKGNLVQPALDNHTMGISSSDLPSPTMVSLAKPLTLCFPILRSVHLKGTKLPTINGKK